MTRLLVYLPSVARGGCEEYALFVARAGVARGVEVTVCLPLLPSTRTFHEDLRDSGIRAVRWSLGERVPPESWGPAADQRAEAESLLASTRPDAILLALPWIDSATGVIAACGRRGSVAVFQLASEQVPIPDAERAAAAQARARGLRFVSVSQENRGFVASSFAMPTDEVQVIPNGSLLEPVAADLDRTQVRAAVRAELGVDLGRRIVTTVARIDCRQKRLDELLGVMPSLCRRFPDLLFVWVGDGPDREALARQATELGVRDHLVMLGHRNDVPRWLQASDLFVLPSSHEGMPFSVLEAMASGCPVVSSSAGGVAEIASHQRDALLVAIGDSNGLEAAIASLLDSPELAARLAASALARAHRSGSRAMLAPLFELLFPAGEAVA